MRVNLLTIKKYEPFLINLDRMPSLVYSRKHFITDCNK